MTIRQRLLLWYTGVLVVSGLGLMVALYLLAAHYMMREMDQFLEDQMVECIAVMHQQPGNPAGLAAAVEFDVSRQRYFPMYVRLYDPASDCDVLAVAPPEWHDALQHRRPTAGAVGERCFSRCPVGRGAREFRVLTMRLGRDTYPGLLFEVGVYIERLNARLSRLRAYFTGSFLVAVLVALMGGSFLAGRSLKPVDELVAALERIESQNLAERLDVPPTDDEVARLRRAVNRMLDRLENAFERVRAFTADAAHELRTPLAALQCQLEVALSRERSNAAYREVVREALAETATLTRTVNDLLRLSRMDAQRGPATPEAVDLAESVDAAAARFAAVAAERGVRLEVACDRNCRIRGEPESLRRLFSNLIDNAICYTPRGGGVTVSLHAEGDACVARVRDTGIGIPREEQEKIFARFYRVDTSRSRAEGGTGLGLSICRSIVTLHGGSIAVTSEPGRGSTFEVRLPREDDGKEDRKADDLA